jgi:glycosyltransferase involved in cell wall biosynthesis
MSLRRVWLIVPPQVAPHAGNAVTAARLAHGLAARGIEVATAEALGGPRPLPGPGTPDVIHALHLRKSAAAALLFADATGAPIVATATGTDLNRDLAEPPLRAEMERLVARAQVLTAYHAAAAGRIGHAFPGAAARAVVVPHGASLEPDRRGEAVARARLAGLGIESDAVVFLWLGGLRAVKDPLLPLVPIVRLRGAGRKVHLVYAGPILDRRHGVAITAAASTYATFIHYLGEVPRGGVPYLLSRASVFVNSSEHEGLSNAVLEAMLAGLPVLARDIEGNRAAIRDGREGLLFRDAAAFESLARRLADDAALRRALGEAGRARAVDDFSPDREVDGYIAAYERARAESRSR